MPWALLAILFFCDTAFWIATGFLQRQFSLTLTFFPAFYVVVAGGVLWSVLKRRHFTGIERDTMPFAFLSAALVAETVIAWSANGILFDIPGDTRVFTLLIPFTILFAQLLAWVVRWDEVAMRRLRRVLWGAALVNAGASIVTFVVFNVLRILPTQIFFANDRYPVILFTMAGKLWVRTPGIFEAGGTNGSFLCLTFALSAAFLLFGGARHRWRWWLLLALQAALIVATLTRRSILVLAVDGAYFAAAALLFRRHSRYIVLGLVGAAAGVGLLATRAHDLAGSESLFQRLNFWTVNLFGLYPAHPERLVVGFAVTQSALRYLPGSPFQIVDNLYLSLLLYGGLPYLFTFVAYQGLLLYANARLARQVWEYQWLAIANVAITTGLLVAGAFVGFVFNSTEALPYLVAQALCTRCVLVHANNVPPEMPPGRAALVQ